MKRINFKNSVIALAIGLSVVSCGGRGGNQQSGTETTDTKTEQATTEKSDGGFTSASLVGVWTDAMKTIFYEFKTGGTGVISYQASSDKKAETFTWKIDGKKVSIDTEDGGFNQFEYIGDNQLEDMMSQKWTKQ
jgi:hypothetical protein